MMAKRKFEMSEKEASFCKNLAARDDLYGKRAKTLLLLNDGLTLTEAGKQTGFSIGQVHYLVRIFKQKGLAVFPEKSAEVVVEVPEKIEPETVVGTEDEQEVVVTMKEEKKKKEKSGKKKKKENKKKGKKGKAKEKEKKAKKDKKKSKAKKSKKSKSKKKK